MQNTINIIGHNLTADKKYLLPVTINEALDMAKSHAGQFKFLAGGTDVITNRFQGNEKSPCLIDLTRITELKGINHDDGYLRIGALEILEDLKFNAELKKRIPDVDRSCPFRWRTFAEKDSYTWWKCTV